jgi:MFS transporter, DHA1 family, multidrug resistance protein
MCLMKYPRWLPPLLGFLTAVGPVSTDMYLPSFPAIEAAFGTPPGTAQITLATWFLGLAVGQMTQGTLADRFGRRWPLLIGTGIYTIASAGCALSPDLFWLSVWRAIAAFGGSASMVIPRAIVRDLAEGHAAARMMSRLMLVMGVAPILAPTLGGAILGFSSWHSIFWITAVYGGICCVVVAVALPDTLRPQYRVRSGLAGVVNRYVSVARDPIWLAYSVLGGFGMFGMFAYIGGSSPVFIEHFGFTPTQYGMLFGASAAMFILATQANPRLLRRFGSVRLVRTALVTYMAGALLMLAFAWSGRGGPAAIVLPTMLAMGSMGLVMPNAAVGALSRHASQAGSASALMGMTQFTMAACSGLLVGLFTDGTPRAMASLLLVGALGAVLADRLRPDPRPVAAAPVP